MKLPFDFGVQLFFRLVVPGFLLACGALPIVVEALDSSGLRNQTELVVVITVLACGWALILADMPIYMLLEGRRFWPSRLREAMRSLEERRLQRILRKVRSPNRLEYLEGSVEYRQYPLSPTGDPEARFPTRLGNAIAAFENYSHERYGLDAVFFWPRIWLQLSKEARETLDGTQALVDSGVYSAFALAVSALMWSVYAALALLDHPIRNIGWGTATSIALFCALGAYGIYKITIFVNAQFGETFKAAIDVTVTRHETFKKDILDTDFVVQQIATQANDMSLVRLPPREKLAITWRYLHNYRIRCPQCDKAIPVPKYRAHVSEEHAVTERNESVRTNLSVPEP